VQSDIPFTMILESPLPFEIPVIDPELAAAHPLVLILFGGRPVVRILLPVWDLIQYLA
jgi:hypothetical protein